VDGTGLQTIVAPKPGVMAANSSWLPDDKGLVYLSTDNPDHQPQVMTIDLASRTLTRLPTPAGVAVSDPHVVGGRVAFPLSAPDRPHPLWPVWLMKADGSGARQLTNPPVSAGGGSGAFPPGDYAPRLSPDGTEVAFMRREQDGWRTM